MQNIQNASEMHEVKITTKDVTYADRNMKNLIQMESKIIR